jgi:hypothetical protein
LATGHGCQGAALTSNRAGRLTIDAAERRSEAITAAVIGFREEWGWHQTAAPT